MNKEPEIWININGFNEYYSISNLGRIKSNARHVSHRNSTQFVPSRLMNGYVNKRGYKIVSLSINGKLKSRKVHQLVLEAFIGNRGENQESRHLDGNKLNNHINNLIWGTSQENTNDNFKNNVVVMGENSPRSILTEDDIYEIIYLRKQGYTYMQLADVFGIFHTQIGEICRGKAWKHVTQNLI